MGRRCKGARIHAGVLRTGCLAACCAKRCPAARRRVTGSSAVLALPGTARGLVGRRRAGRGARRRLHVADDGTLEAGSLVPVLSLVQPRRLAALLHKAQFCLAGCILTSTCKAPERMQAHLAHMLGGLAVVDGRREARPGRRRICALLRACAGTGPGSHAACMQQPARVPVMHQSPRARRRTRACPGLRAPALPQGHEVDGQQQAAPQARSADRSHVRAWQQGRRRIRRALGRRGQQQAVAVGHRAEDEARGRPAGLRSGCDPIRCSWCMAEHCRAWRGRPAPEQHAWPQSGQRGRPEVQLQLVGRAPGLRGRRRLHARPPLACDHEWGVPPCCTPNKKGQTLLARAAACGACGCT